MHYFRKSCVFSLAILLAALPFVASADVVMANVVTTKDYVDETTVAKDQSTRDSNGTVTATNVGDIMQVETVSGVGILTRKTPLASIDRTHTGSSNKSIPTERAVVNFAVQKPESVANGKVLTFQSGTLTDQPTAQYIKVPVATGDPNATSNPANPTGFASIWLQ